MRQPLDIKVGSVSLVQLPVDAGVFQGSDQDVQADAGADRQVVAPGETMNRDSHGFIGQVRKGCRQARLLGAEAEREFVADIQLIHGLASRGRVHGDDAVAPLFELFDTGAGIVLFLTVMPDEVYPFRGPLHHRGIEAVLVEVLDDVEFLDAEAFTGTHDRAGVLGLVDVFQDYCDMAGPLPENLLQAFPALLVDDAGQVIDDVLLFFRSHVAN